jgi:hypothetical protein
MLQALVLIERDAVVDAAQLAPRPDVLVLRELADETPTEFAERVVRRLARQPLTGALHLGRYFVGRFHGDERLRSRCRIMRAVLEACRVGADLTFVTHQLSGEVQVEMFSLVDELRDELSRGAGFQLRFAQPRETELLASA